MIQRPTIGAVGRTVSALTPDGQAEFDGVPIAVRAQGGLIDPGRSVLVIGFDPRWLIVREATPEERAAAHSVTATPAGPAPWSAAAEEFSDPTGATADSGRASTAADVARYVVGSLVFGGVAFILILLSFRAGEAAGIAFLVAQIGQVWLLVLIVRECPPDAIFLALLIPFFTWYFAYQRWDIAKWPFLLNLAGSLVALFGVCAGVE
jgi:hypothetical protein